MELKQGIMTMIVMAGETFRALSAKLGVKVATLRSRVNMANMKVDTLTNLADKCGFDVMLVQRPQRQVRGVGQVKIRIDTYWTVAEQMRIENRLYQLALEQDRITDADRVALWEFVGEVNNKKITKYFGLNKENAAPYTANEQLEEPKMDVDILSGKLKYKDIAPVAGRKPMEISVTSKPIGIESKKEEETNK